MKIIDLLNKIANGEEVPNKIHIKKFQCDFIFNGYTYLSDEKAQRNIYWCSYSEALNYEVEILEEPKKIEYPILHETVPSEITGDQMPNWRNLIDCNFKYLNKTICQLIDEINKLKEK